MLCIWQKKRLLETELDDLKKSEGKIHSEMFVNEKNFKPCFTWELCSYQLNSKLNLFVALLIYWLSKSCSHFTDYLWSKYEYWHLFQNKENIMYVNAEWHEEVFMLWLVNCKWVQWYCSTSTFSEMVACT
jgi:hypothetical protein